MSVISLPDLSAMVMVKIVCGCVLLVYGRLVVNAAAAEKKAAAEKNAAAAAKRDDEAADAASFSSAATPASIAYGAIDAQGAMEAPLVLDETTKPRPATAHPTDKQANHVKKKGLKQGYWSSLIGASLIFSAAYQLNYFATFCLVVFLTVLGTLYIAITLYRIDNADSLKEYLEDQTNDFPEGFVAKNKYQDLSSDDYSWIVFLLPQLAAFCGQAYSVWNGHLALGGQQEELLALLGIFFLPMFFVNSGLTSILPRPGKKHSKILRFWTVVIKGCEKPGPRTWEITGKTKTPKYWDALFRCLADLLVNFVYPMFLFMVFPVFVARGSGSYMDAINAATSVLFAVKWDEEDADIKLKLKK